MATPALVVFSDESRIANAMEPAAATTTETSTTAIRKRRFFESPERGDVLSIRPIIPPSE
jgi:hypothetical protein